MSELRKTVEIDPWEDRVRQRYLFVSASVAALKAGRRSDTEDVLRELWQTWNGIDFLLTVHPEQRGNFFISLIRDCLGNEIAAVEDILDREENWRDSE